MKKNKIGIISFILSFIMVINIIMPVKVFADTTSEKAKLEQEIETLKKEVKSRSPKDYLDCLTLRALGEPVDKSQINLIDNISSAYDNENNSKVNAQNILKLVCVKEDVNSEKYKKYVEALTNGLSEKGFLSQSGREYIDLDLNTTALCIIALELAHVDYDKEKAKQSLLNYVKTELEKDTDSVKNIEPITNAIIALNLLKVENYNNYIDRFLDIFKYSINHEGKIEIDNGTWPSYNGSLIQALILIGQDPTSEDWTSEDGLNLIDGLNSFKYDTDTKNLAKLSALVDYYNFKYGNKKSMYNLDYEISTPSKIEFENSNIKIKEGKEQGLNIKIYDEKNNPMIGEAFVFTNHNKDLVELDERSLKVKALKCGNAKIEVALKKNNNIKANLDIEVYKNPVSKIEININEDYMPIKVNDIVTVETICKDDEDDRVYNSNFKYSSDNENIVSIDNKGNLTAKKVGKVNIKVSIEDNETVYAEKEIEIQDNLGLNEISKKDHEKIKAEVENLKNYYLTETKDGLVPLALSKIGVVKKAYIRRNCANAYDLSLNIFATIGSGENPRNYQNNNYVEQLKEIQKKDGENKGQFIKNDYSDKNNLKSQCYAVLALDLAKEEYDKKSAIESIIDLSKNGDGDTTYTEVQKKALVALVLAGVDKDIEKTKYLKSLILDMKNEFLKNGQFQCKNDRCRSTALVIQALVANNINPLGKDFTYVKGEEKKNLFDVLLSYKSDQLKNGNPYFGFANGIGYGSNVINAQSTTNALCALVDLYNKESNFGIKSSVDMDNGEAPKITIIGVENNKVYKGDVNVEISSTEGNKWTAKLNGENFTGGKFTTSGIHTLEVVAENDKGLKTTKSLQFAIDKNQSTEINLRVEGREKTLFNEKIKVGEGSKNVLDLIKISLGLDKVKLRETNNMMVASILDEKELEGKYGWCYLILKNNKVEHPGVGMDSYKIDKENLSMDEIVLYVSDYKDTDIKTQTPNMTYKVKVDKVILNFNSYNKSIRGMDVTVNNKKYITDDNGNIEIEKEEVLNISIGKRSSSEGILFVPMNYVINIEMENTKPEELDKEEIKVENLTDENSFKLGQEGKVRLKVTNTFKEEKDLNFIVGLYDDNNKLVDYISLENKIKANKSTVLESMMVMPSNGKYTVKAFLWDNLDNMNSLCDNIVIKVK
ncbi:Ig-like domain-containing protein [Clostridium ihumii]|uniref:Ig-like domain-containing protein n=1 Tax=Clostridium ihumii TaxID=1470356 RepID=UPI003D32B22E